MPNTHSTLTSLFSDIADAIRVKKGTSADIVADNFPDEIASITGGGAGGDYDIEVVDDGEGGQILNITDAQGGGGDPVFKKWTVTVPSQSTASTTLLTDTWLRDNRNNPNLVVCWFPVSAVSSNTVSYTCGGFCTNRIQGDGTTNDVHGATTRTATSGAAASASTMASALNGSPTYTVGEMLITAAGALTVYATSSVVVLAGTYMVYAWIAE